MWEGAYLFVGPCIGEPANDTGLQFPGDTPESHVLFDPVHTVLEVNPRHVHITDHTADIADNRSEDKHPGQEVCHHEQILRIVLWLGRLSCQQAV